MGRLATITRTLRSQKVGVVCGFASATLLGLGSIIMDLAPEDYAGLRWDDMVYFIDPPRLAYWWFYLLGLAIGVWGLSSVLCTWESLKHRIKHRVARPSAYGAPILHIAFVLALFVHLWSGLSAETRSHVVRGDQATEINGARYRTLTIEPDLYPTGMPRGVTVTLEREQGGVTAPVAVGYNEPHVEGAGVTALLLGRYAYQPSGAVLRVGGQVVTLLPGHKQAVGDTVVRLAQIYQGGSLRVPVADVWLQPVGGGAEEREMAAYSPRARGQGRVDFVGFERTPVVQLTERYNPSTPLVILVSFLAVLGVLLVALEHLWRRRRRLAQAAASAAAPAGS